MDARTRYEIDRATALVDQVYQMVEKLEALRAEKKSAAAALHKLTEDEIVGLGLTKKLQAAEEVDRALAEAADMLRTAGQGSNPVAGAAKQRTEARKAQLAKAAAKNGKPAEPAKSRAAKTGAAK